MPKQKFKNKLPPQHHFTLSHILSQESVRANLQNVNDSIINTVTLYKKDIADELRELTKTENELITKIQHVEEVYNIMHNLRVEAITDTQILESERKINGINSKSRKNKNKGISMFGLTFNKQEDNQLDQLLKIEENLNYIIEESVSQKKRMDRMVNRLKKIETKLPKRLILFDEDSSLKEHYKDLYDYGMKDSNTKANNRKVKRNSVSSSKSKISQQKLNQYLTIENELEQLAIQKSNQMQENSKSSLISLKENTSSILSADMNPIIYVMGQKIPTPTCKINEELVTIRNDNVNDQNGSSDLVDELKKLYK